MNRSNIAFIGDVHGNLEGLELIFERISAYPVDQIVLVGDYIDHGPDSSGVLDFLMQQSNERNVTALRGNHEDNLLTALATGEVANFLVGGGVPTIRSYSNEKCPPDVVEFLRAIIPIEHVRFIETMPSTFENDEILATHRPLELASNKFLVSGHRFIGDVPIVTSRSAQLDTGSGLVEGKLSALLYPSMLILDDR